MEMGLRCSGQTEGEAGVSACACGCVCAARVYTRMCVRVVLARARASVRVCLQLLWTEAGGELPCSPNPQVQVQAEGLSRGAGSLEFGPGINALKSKREKHRKFKKKKNCNARDLAKQKTALTSRSRPEVRTWSACISGPERWDWSSGMFQTPETSAQLSVLFPSQRADLRMFSAGTEMQGSGGGCS